MVISTTEVAFGFPCFLVKTDSHLLSLSFQFTLIKLPTDLTSVFLSYKEHKFIEENHSEVLSAFLIVLPFLR